MTVKRFTPVLDGDLAEWPKDSAFRPTAVNALADNVQLDHRYFLSQDEQGLYLQQRSSMPLSSLHSRNGLGKVISWPCT